MSHQSNLPKDDDMVKVQTIMKHRMEQEILTRHNFSAKLRRRTRLAGLGLTAAVLSICELSLRSNLDK